MSSPIQTDRKSCPSPHSLGNKCGRILWAVVWFSLFRPSPAIFRAWRRFLLRCFGAKLGRGVNVMPTARIWAPWNLTMGDHACLSSHVDCYCVAPISIGSHSTISQYVHLCAASHDISDVRMALVSAPIYIREGAWICAGAFISMGVTVGQGAVAGARAMVTADIEPWTVVAGNPASFVKKRILNDTGSR